jgi:alpha-beta hydrolase superfamily lysophospholipase
MQSSTFRFKAADGLQVHTYRWLPDGAPPKAVVQIAHGLAEHAGRYARLAQALTGAGYAVYANDHRGHGKSLFSPAELGFFAERDGWNRALADVYQLGQLIAGEQPGRPLVLLGHSMGSFMAQQAMYERGETFAGVVLSGTGGKPPRIASAGLVLCKLERLRLGTRGRSPLVNALSFGSFNKAFEPARTPFDWLSRDPAEVDKYVADPLCGFIACVQTWYDVLVALREIAKPENQARVPKSLPVWVICGGEDPVGGRTAGPRQLLEAYQAAGLINVGHKFYAGARHELFNETNRDEVTADLIAWLARAIHR